MIEVDEANAVDANQTQAPDGWGFQELPDGIFGEDEFAMLTHAGRHMGRLATQTLEPAKRQKKKRRLLEWFDTYEGIEKQGAAVSLDIKNQMAYCSSRGAPAQLSRINYKKWYKDGFQNFEALTDQVEDEDKVMLELGNHYISASVIDNESRMLYLATSDQPSLVIKVNIDTYEIVEKLTLGTGENQVSSMLIDKKDQMLYLSTWTVQAKVVSVATGCGAVPFSRVECLNLDFSAGDSYLRCACHDFIHGDLYFGTSSQPAKIIKVAKIPLSHIKTFELPDGLNAARCAVIEPDCKFCYFGMETKPGTIVEVDIENFCYTRTLHLPDGYDDVRCAAYDELFFRHKIAYFCTFASPCHIVKVDLDKFTIEKSLVLDTGEDKCAAIAIDGKTGIALMYLFGGDRDPGKLVRICTKPKVVIDAVLDEVEVQALEDYGEHEAERERQMRERFKQLRATQLVQRWARHRLAVKKARAERARLIALRDNATSFIQRVMRGLLGRLRYKRIRLAYFNQNRATAMAVAQRAARASKQAVEVRDNNREMDWLNKRVEAIMFIQRLWRGRSGRMNFLARLAQQHHYDLCWEYASKIQRLWRGRSGRRIFQIALELKSSIQIQQMVRGRFSRDEKNRRAYAWMLSEQERASLVIGAGVRGYQARRRVKRLRRFQAETRAALKIQCRIRVARAKKRLAQMQMQRQIYLNMLACRIQNLWRAYTARRAAWGKRRGRLEGRAAEILQAVIRQYVTKKRYQQTIIARNPQLYQQCGSWLKMHEKLRKCLRHKGGESDPRVQNLAKNATVSCNIISMECLKKGRYSWAFALIKRTLYFLRVPGLDFAAKDQLVALTNRNIQQVRYRLYDTYP